MRAKLARQTLEHKDGSDETYAHYVHCVFGNRKKDEIAFY